MCPEAPQWLPHCLSLQHASSALELIWTGRAEPGSIQSPFDEKKKWTSNKETCLKVSRRVMLQSNSWNHTKKRTCLKTAQSLRKRAGRVGGRRGDGSRTDKRVQPANTRRHGIICLFARWSQYHLVAFHQIHMGDFTWTGLFAHKAGSHIANKKLRWQTDIFQDIENRSHIIVSQGF